MTSHEVLTAFDSYLRGIAPHVQTRIDFLSATEEFEFTATLGLAPGCEAVARVRASAWDLDHAVYNPGSCLALDALQSLADSCADHYGRRR